MALEETLEVYDQDDAREVAAALRKKGISVRITRRDALMRTIGAVGKIRDLKAVLEEGIAQIEDDEVLPWLKRSLASLGEEEEDVADFLQQYPSGAVVTGALPKKTLPELYQLLWEEGVDEEAVREEIAELLKVRRIFLLLERNDLIRMTEDGEAILHGQIEPADLVTERSGEIIEVIGPGALKKHGIKINMTIISDPIFRLEFSAKAISMVEIEDLDDLLEEMELDPDEYDGLRDSISAKRAVVLRIMDLLRARGTAPAREIFSLLQSGAFEASDGIDTITMDLDFEFVSRLLDDMRKIGMVRRKGVGYRLA